MLFEPWCADCGCAADDFTCGVYLVPKKDLSFTMGGPLGPGSGTFSLVWDGSAAWFSECLSNVAWLTRRKWALNCFEGKLGISRVTYGTDDCATANSSSTLFRSDSLGAVITGSPFSFTGYYDVGVGSPTRYYYSITE